MKIIGRELEKAQLRRLRESQKSEFVMVYGRRRVGKTFLVREFFDNDFAFYNTGIANGTYREQLLKFNMKLLDADPSLEKSLPKNWFEAFHALSQVLAKSTCERKVVFLDELPWMDTPRSNFIKALEVFWNEWASARSDILLIVCGSAASWMVRHIVRNHGGLHNRITCKIKLNAFSLHEVEDFLQAKNVHWDRTMTAECYMALGGIPYYLDLIDPGLSLAQNIDRLFFSDSALLGDEFNNLYASLFAHSEAYVSVVNVLARHRQGCTQSQILHGAGRAVSVGGGTFSAMLEALEQCGFVRSYKAQGSRSRLYQLVDFFSLFYFSFVKGNSGYDDRQWENMMRKPAYFAWRGLSFERLCFAHLRQIKQALGIGGVATRTYEFRSPQAQIDMVIDRDDNVLDLCEMKFTDDPYVLTRKDAESLKNKISALRMAQKRRKSINVVLVASAGLNANAYATSLVSNVVTLDQLFC